MPRPRLGPVLDDAEIARMLEQGVDALDDHDVEVEEQDRPVEIVELRREAAELAPGRALPLGQRASAPAAAGTRPRRECRSGRRSGRPAGEGAARWRRTMLQSVLT